MTTTRSARDGGRCRTTSAILVALALAAAAPEARATVAAYRSARELTEGASSIFRGRVIDRSAHWQGDLIVTDVLVGIDECWAGDCIEDATVVREIGGEVDGVGMLSPEPTPLAIGEEVVVFGRRRGRVLEAVGGAQGVFRVEATTSTTVATRDLASVTDLPASPEEMMTVPALRREVLRALARVEE